MSWIEEITGLGMRAFEDYSFKTPDLIDYLNIAPSYIDFNRRRNILNLRNTFFHIDFYQNCSYFYLYLSKLNPTIIFDGECKDNLGVKTLICDTINIRKGNPFCVQISEDGSVTNNLEITKNGYPPSKDKWFEEANSFLSDFSNKYGLENKIKKFLFFSYT